LLVVKMETAVLSFPSSQVPRDIKEGTCGAGWTECSVDTGGYCCCGHDKQQQDKLIVAREM
jgi:hypothetical protein